MSNREPLNIVFERLRAHVCVSRPTISISYAGTRKYVRAIGYDSLNKGARDPFILPGTNFGSFLSSISIKIRFSFILLNSSLVLSNLDSVVVVSGDGEGRCFQQRCFWVL